MSKRILVLISGKKRSGKDTLANSLIRRLKVSSQIFAYANKFKNHLIDFFGLDSTIVYGSDEQKNQNTEYFWEDMVGDHGKTGPITYREFMQYWGTEVCRRLKYNIHVNNLLKDVSSFFGEGLGGIQYAYDQIAYVTDCRFPNEISLAKEYGEKKGWIVISVRLTRGIVGDSHSSETALDSNLELFDHIVDNTKLNEEEQAQVVEEIIRKKVGELAEDYRGLGTLKFLGDIPPYRQYQDIKMVDWQNSEVVDILNKSVQIMGT